MEPIAKVLQTVHPGLPEKVTSGKSVSVAGCSEPIRQTALRRLWERMAAIYGHKWVSAYGASCEEGDSGKLTIAGDTWQRGLVGIVEKDIGIGLDACLRGADPWPPALPEFRALCLEIPTLPSVRLELRSQNSDRSPFARLVWQYIDSHLYRLADLDRADRMLRDAYELAREDVMCGGALPEPPVAELEAPQPVKPVRADPERAKPWIDELAQLLGDVVP